MSFRYIPPFLRRDVLGAALKDCTHYAINDSIEFIATFAPWRRQGIYLIRYWHFQIVALRVIRAAVLRICAHSFLGRLSRRLNPITVVTGPNTLGVVSTHSGYSSVFSSMLGVLFGTLNTFYFQQNTSPYISHDTDTTMTHYDTGGTEIP
jgi:hypothetical protein